MCVCVVVMSLVCFLHEESTQWSNAFAAPIYHHACHDGFMAVICLNRSAVTVRIPKGGMAHFTLETPAPEDEVRML